jgi:hypothetical protein
MLRAVHAGRFPNRSFGKDLQLIVVYGTVILRYIEGKTPNIASIARYLELPHESTRRYLKTIVGLGLLAKNGRGYRPTERTLKGIAGVDIKYERLLKRNRKGTVTIFPQKREVSGGTLAGRGDGSHRRRTRLR